MTTLERAIAIACEAHAGQTEDAPDWLFARLRDEGFDETVLAALEAVTKREHESGSDSGYFAFVERASADPIGRLVKLADLKDNADLSRIAEIDLARVEKYLRDRAAGALKRKTEHHAD